MDAEQEYALGAAAFKAGDAATGAEYFIFLVVYLLKMINP